MYYSMQLIKRFVGLLAILIIFASCMSSDKTALHAAQNVKGSAVYGDSIKEGNVLDLGGMQTIMQKAEKMDMRLLGKVDNVCGKDGCCIMMKLENGKAMCVTFKNQAFVVPKSVIGKNIMLKGTAYRDTALIKKQHQYAISAGLISKQETTQPTPELAFEASGVVIL